MDDVAEDHQVIRIVSEIHLPHVALMIFVSSGDAEFFSKLPGYWSHLRKIHGPPARLRNGLGKCQRPRAGASPDVQNTMDFAALFLWKTRDRRLGRGKIPRENACHQFGEKLFAFLDYVDG